MPEQTPSPPGGIGREAHQNHIREIVMLIRKLMQAGELYTKELNKKHQISTPQLNCLLTLAENGPMPPSQIARNILVNSSTVTGIIDRLEQKGLVTRLRDSPDRRVINIRLTEDGASLARNAPPPVQEKMIQGLKKLSVEEIEEIVAGLRKLTSMLEVQDLTLL